MKAKPKRAAITLGASFLKSVDEWRRKQRDHPSQAVAIRRLAERGGLASSIIPRRRSKGSRRKAAEMAGQEIDSLGGSGHDQRGTRAAKGPAHQGPARVPRDTRRLAQKQRLNRQPEQHW